MSLDSRTLKSQMYTVLRMILLPFPMGDAMWSMKNLAGQRSSTSRARYSLLLWGYHGVLTLAVGNIVSNYGEGT